LSTGCSAKQYSFPGSTVTTKPPASISFELKHSSQLNSAARDSGDIARHEKKTENNRNKQGEERKTKIFLKAKKTSEGHFNQENQTPKRGHFRPQRVPY